MRSFYKIAGVLRASGFGLLETRVFAMAGQTEVGQRLQVVSEPWEIPHNIVEMVQEACIGGTVNA